MVHPWPAFSPEVNYTALASGSGPASTLAYAETLSAQAAQVRAVVAASTANAATTYGTTWRGAGASASAVAQAALDTQHELLAAALLEKASHVAAAAGAHQSAVASMVTAQDAVANRRDEATAQQINPLVWGALTPQIVALNLEYYGQMWPRNAAAGAAYGAALRAAAAAIMVPFPPAVSGGSPAMAAAGLAETGAISAAEATLQAGEQAAHALIVPATVGAGKGGCAAGAVGRLGLSVGVPEWCLGGGQARRGSDASPGAAASDGDVRPGRPRRRSRRRQPSHPGSRFCAAQRGDAEPRGHPIPASRIGSSNRWCGQQLSGCGSNQLHSAHR
nr:PPE domain-containing protein [Mycobacterium kansasii]